MVDAGKRLDLPYLPDINTSTTLASGCANAYYTLNPSGSRESSFTAFLPASLARARKSHLHICTGSVATRLDIQTVDGSLRVLGAYIRPVAGKSTSVHVSAKREVILCAGPLENPKLLQLRSVVIMYYNNHILS